MKILIVCSHKPQLSDGCVPFIREQVEALREQGCECEYYHIKGKGMVGYLREVPKLRKKIREWKPDVVHGHFGLSCLVANMATRRVPVVSTYHGSDINLKKNRKFSQLAMWLSRWNIFVSKRTMEMVHGEKRKDSSLIPCGVNLPQPWSELQKHKVEQLTLNQWVEGVLESNRKHVLFAGAFDNAIKDPELAIDAIASLNEKINIDKHSYADINRDKDLTKKDESTVADSNLQSTIPYSAHMQASGQTNDQLLATDADAHHLSDSSEKNELLHISTKNPKNEVELIELKGYNREQVNALMYSCDCLLMTSKTEGSPQVIKETMACGCPIVSVDVGDVAERTEGVEGCLVVKSREPREIAEALEKALVFEGRTKGREKIIEYGLTNEQVAKKIIKIYEDILKS